MGTIRAVQAWVARTPYQPDCASEGTDCADRFGFGPRRLSASSLE